MKTIGVNLKAHISGEVTTLAMLWRVTRLDGAVYGFTDHDSDITYQGVTYSAMTGVSSGAIRGSADLAVDNLDVDGILDSAAITDADLLAGLWDYASCIVMRVNYADLSMGHEVLKSGTFGNVKTGRVHFSTELRGLSQPLQQTIGRFYKPGCDANLGDARCGVSLPSYTVSGAVTTVTTQSAFSDSSRAEAAGHFSLGLLTFTSGFNAGRKMEVKSFSAGGAFVLQQAMPNAITVGDTYSVHAGCDKRLETCRDKFSNVANFRGFPHFPGMDRMVSGS